MGEAKRRKAEIERLKSETERQQRELREQGKIPRGLIPESWCCIDCNINTAPGFTNRVETEQAFKADRKGSVEQTVGESSEVYTVRSPVWKQAGMEPFGGCLCIGCLEKRLGRQLRPEDFDQDHPFYELPGTVRLESRKIGTGILTLESGLFAVCDGEPTRVKTMKEAESVIGKWISERPELWEMFAA
jgi:hypothetical protein